MPQIQTPLSKRWFPYKVNTKHAAEQCLGYLNSTKRFNVTVGGRRQYKSETAKRRGVRAATSYHDPASPFFCNSENYNVAFLAPTHEQAYRIYWNDLLELIPKAFVQYINVQRRVIGLKNGACLYVIGADMAARLEGVMWHRFFIDEFPNIKEDVWFEHLRPCLSDTLGGCDFLGVPEGKHNHFYTMWSFGQTHPDEYDCWHWTSAEVLSVVEVEKAKAEYDEATFRQEYEGSFENYQGRAYYAFDRDTHCAVYAYDKQKPLWITFDFNVRPGVAILGQYCEENGKEVDVVIDEAYIASNSNTEKICGLLTQRYFQHQGTIEIDGDATGGAHDTTSSRTDWEIVRSMFDSTFGKKMRYLYPRHNPHERDRINAVNARLKSYNGEIKLKFANKALKTIEDMDKTTLDDKGDIDKKTNVMVSHMSDAVGYHIARKYPIKKYEPSNDQYYK